MCIEEQIAAETISNAKRCAEPDYHAIESGFMRNNSRFNYGSSLDKPYVFKDNKAEEPVRRTVGYDMNPKDMYKPAVKQAMPAIDSLYSVN